MSLDNILRRRALRLKAALTENGQPEPGILSTIYPAMDHGENSPHTVKTPASIPGFNSAEGEPDFEPEKPGDQVDEPGPSKGASFSQPAIPGQSAMVPDAHKRAAMELGYFGENRSEQFIKRCVEIITGVSKIKQEDQEETVDVQSDSSGEAPGGSRLSSVAAKFKKVKDKSTTHD